MKLLKVIIVILIPFSILFSQEKKIVLVEVFTNSHCPLCPPAHTTIDNYIAGPNGDKINFIFYHMEYPYPDDLLYQENSIDSDGRHNYYNPVRATPRGFFDGQIQSSTSGWASTLDNLVMNESPLKIILNGTKMENSFNVKAGITKTGDLTDTDLVIQFVVVENLNFTGRNNITHHKNVMRDMVDDASGSSISLNTNETVEIEREVAIQNEWMKDSLKIIVFIQSSSSKTVYQSSQIKYTELQNPTGIGEGIDITEEFNLNQNYPNPFNPSTTISYQLPEDNFVTLKVYNLLGKEVSTLVNETQTAGSYIVEFSANGGSSYDRNERELSSGIYFYKLVAVNSSGKEIIQTKKMTLIK